MEIKWRVDMANAVAPRLLGTSNSNGHFLQSCEKYTLQMPTDGPRTRRIAGTLAISMERRGLKFSSRGMRS